MMNQYKDDDQKMNHYQLRFLKYGLLNYVKHLNGFYVYYLPILSLVCNVHVIYEFFYNFLQSFQIFLNHHHANEFLLEIHNHTH